MGASKKIKFLALNSRRRRRRVDIWLKKMSNSFAFIPLLQENQKKSSDGKKAASKTCIYMLYYESE